jgi:hypothetical protein
LADTDGLAARYPRFAIFESGLRLVSPWQKVLRFARIVR